MKTALQRVEASLAVSVSTLKKSPTAVMDDAKSQAAAVLNHNRVMAYIVSADTYETMLERLDDLDLVEIVRARADERGVPVALDEL